VNSTVFHATTKTKQQKQTPCLKLSKNGPRRPSAVLAGSRSPPATSPPARYVTTTTSLPFSPSSPPRHDRVSLLPMPHPASNPPTIRHAYFEYRNSIRSSSPLGPSGLQLRSTLTTRSPCGRPAERLVSSYRACARYREIKCSCVRGRDRRYDRDREGEEANPDRSWRRHRPCLARVYSH
jgi:hypothetical protein